MDLMDPIYDTMGLMGRFDDGNMSMVLPAMSGNMAWQAQNYRYLQNGLEIIESSRPNSRPRMALPVA